MKNLIFLSWIIVLISCQKSKKEDTNYQKIETEKITPGHVVHESLSQLQLQRIKKIHTTFIEVYPISIKETITNFKRDQNPDKEIEVWLAMADAFEKFSSKNRGDQLLGKRKEAFKLILMRSMMSEKEAVKDSKFETLTKKEVEEILGSYLLGEKPIKIETH